MNKPVDLTGQRFGKLVALCATTHTTRTGRQIRAWECVCDCGNVKTVRIQTLRNGDTRSCGCLARSSASDRRRVDLTGQVFGLWTVRGVMPARDKRGCVRWDCLCSCGTVRFLTTSTLRSTATQSCGCRRDEKARERLTGRSPVGKLPPGESRFHALIDKYRRRAARFGHVWDLDKSTARSLFTANCYYCDRQPMHQIHGTRANGSFTYNGIDRLDSSKGYVVGNVVTACGDCNKAKLALSESQFLDLVRRIYTNRVLPSATAAAGAL